MIIEFIQPGLDWLGEIIKWLVQIGGSIAVGIILFTLILKIITLPFDFFSRLSMRKNSLKMEEMRPELERLQKQYANDKVLYNQKMMALYKQNGYSMFGACLPTIITLVIFIIALQGFNGYSSFKNKENFYHMVNAYNNVVYAGFDIDGEYILRDENGVIVFDDNKIIKETSPISVKGKINGEEYDFEIIHEESDISGQKYYKVYTTNSYMVYERNYFEDVGNYTFGTISYVYTTDNTKITPENPLASKENNYLKSYEGKTYSELGGMTIETFMTDVRESVSAAMFREETAGFLWVKNIWITDSPFAHPVESEFKEANFKDTKLTAENYNHLVAKLSTEKNAPNGFFILAVLTAAVSFLMQFITTKSQKAQMELQSVDGQGMGTQKMMMWLMPIMMAVFAFIYTAAFSIYMILSSSISILTTLLINAYADKKYKKSKAALGKEVVRGRVYVPKEEPKEDKKKNKKQPDTGDFLTGPVKKNKKK